MKNGKKSGGGLLGGLALIVLGVMLLFWNEGRTVAMQSAINEGMKSYKDVTSEQIDSKNEGQLIATTGKLDLSNSGELKDQKFGITVKGAKLRRNVEMYQWIEECTTDENDKETCNYKKDWSSNLEDSSEFKESGHSNPTSFKYESEDFLAPNVKVGAFDLPERLLNNLSYNQKLNNEKLTAMYTTPVEDFRLEGNYITNTKADTETVVGDLRISYEYASDGEVSLLGVQNGSTLTAFTGKKGKSLFEIRRGSHTGKEILTDMTKSNNKVKWLFRIIGTLVVIIGTGSLFAPLQSLTNRIPVVGSIVNTGTGLISTVLGLAISLVVIAIAWFRYRPILSVVLLAIVIGLLVFLKLNKKDQPKKIENQEIKTNEN